MFTDEIFELFYALDHASMLEKLVDIIHKIVPQESIFYYEKFDKRFIHRFKYEHIHLPLIPEHIERNHFLYPLMTGKEVTLVPQNPIVPHAILIIPQRYQEDVLGAVLLVKHMTDVVLESQAKELNQIVKISGIAQWQKRRFSTLIQLQEQERDGIADILHDEVADALALVRKSLNRSLQANAPINAKDLHDLENITDLSRNLSHNLGVLRVINQFDLLTALQILFDNFTRQTNIVVNFPQPQIAEKNLELSLKLTIYRVVQEAIVNATRYAEVDEIFISITDSPELILKIEDYGKGFSYPLTSKGIGLLGMEQRVLLANGKFSLQTGVGQGTKITARFPLTQTSVNTLSSKINLHSVRNLTVFARLFGYIRYFYAGINAVTVLWEAFCIKGIQLTQSARNDDELLKILQDLFAPIAPELEIRALMTPLTQQPSSEHEYFTYWKHHGFGTGWSSVNLASKEDTNWMAESLRLRHGFGLLKEPEKYISQYLFAKRQDIEAQAAPIWYQATLGDIFHCQFPVMVATPYTSANFFSNLPLDNNENLKGELDFQTQKIMNVIIIWNILQHFSPYLDDAEVNWFGVLTEALRRCLNAYTENDVFDTLRWLIAQSGDGSARLSRVKSDLDKFVPLFQWGWVENSLIITWVSHTLQDNLQIGDKVLSINRQSIETVLAQEEQYVTAASATYRRLRATALLLRGDFNSELIVQTSKGSFTFHRTLDTKILGMVSDPRPDMVFCEVKEGLYYLDLTRITQNSFNDHLHKIITAQAVIFDARGISQISISQLDKLIAHLVTEPVRSLTWLISDVLYPDRNNFQFTPIEHIVSPRNPLFQGRCVFLMDTNSIGSIENMLSMVKAYNLGTLIGTQSAGSCGHVDIFNLSEQYIMWWTAMKVLNHDDSRFHGNGVMPDVWVESSKNSILYNRDTQFEHALNFLSE